MLSNKSLLIILVCIVLLCFSGAVEVFAQTKTNHHLTKVTPNDVYKHVAIVRAELDLLRLSMRKPISQQRNMHIRHAAPREVFHQALTLFRKANRLSFEHTRHIHPEPSSPAGNIQAGHVFNMLDAALNILRDIKARRDIETAIVVPTLTDNKNPEEVFQSIVYANQQLNLLLDKRFAPKDVYQLVSLCIGFTSRLLALFPNRQAIPAPQSFQDHMQPKDVYLRLFKLFSLLSQVGQRHAINMLQMDNRAVDMNTIVPSDVYDLASLLVSELSYIHSLHPELQAARTVYDPGTKTASQVYQRVSILEKQLQRLASQDEKYPDILKKQRAD